MGEISCSWSGELQQQFLRLLQQSDFYFAFSCPEFERALSQIFRAEQTLHKSLEKIINDKFNRE